MYMSLCFYGKLVSFILLVIAMVIINNYNIFLLVCGMVFILSFINKKKRYFFLCLILFLSTYLIEFNDITFIVLRILLIIAYALIIESSLLSLEKRYLYDKLFYRNKNSNKIKGYICKYYYRDLYNNNMESNKRIEKYLDNPDKFKKYLKTQAEKKAYVEIDNLYLLDRIRFDRFFNKKKSRLPFSWNNYDNFYIAVSLFLFVLVIVLGR